MAPLEMQNARGQIEAPHPAKYGTQIFQSDLTIKLFYLGIILASILRTLCSSVVQFGICCSLRTSEG